MKLKKIALISDTHGRHAELSDKLKGIHDGDILIHAGDLSNEGTYSEIVKFLQWMAVQPFNHKAIIAGNHDFGFEGYGVRINASTYVEGEKMKSGLIDLCKELGITYLEDSMVEIEGIKIYGSPYTPLFYDWAFMRDAENIKKIWSKIPENLDILVVHGPAFGYGDLNSDGIRCGCPYLLERIKQVKPKYHVFGHIHEARGIYRSNEPDLLNTTFINATSVNGWTNMHGPFLIHV